MKKGTYRSDMSRDVVITMEVKFDMSDAEFEYALQRALGDSIQGPFIQGVVINKREE